MKKGFVFIVAYLLFNTAFSQVDDSKTGAWYMYFWNTSFSKNIGLQGDIQHRNWNLGGDLEQLLIRGGLTYTSDISRNKFTLGYAHITSGTYGSSDATSVESRIYQEALLPHSIGLPFKLTHRFRYEQRFVENQDFRTRIRYALFANIPINQSAIVENTLYLALYNEIFINGEKQIGNGISVETFDRNRFYMGLGWAFSPNKKVQLGWMKQSNNNFTKEQLQVSFHHSF